MNKKFWSEFVDVVPKGSLPVYEIDKTEVRPEMVYELAKRFEMEGEMLKKDDEYIMAQKKRVLTVYRNTGAFCFTDFAKLHSHDYRPELPSEDEASEIAMEFLKKNGWMPEGAVLDGIHRNTFERIEGKEREKKKWVNSLSVDFRLSIDELKTYGPGAKIKVLIGHKGEVIGLFRAVPSVARYAELTALSREELEEILVKKLGVPLDRVNITDVKLALHAESCVLGGRFLQPVYVFEISSKVISLREKEEMLVECELHPLPATPFSPVVTIGAPTPQMEIKFGEPLTLNCEVKGGSPPYKFKWESNVDGYLGDERVLETKRLTVAHRCGKLTSHTIKATVTDNNGMQDSHVVLVKVHPSQGRIVRERKRRAPDDPDDPYVGVEWCNDYSNVPNLANISGTDDSAQGFKNAIQSLSNWSSRFDWGNDAAWEQDFKHSTAPGGGTDSFWADNVHFAFFAGHGGSGQFFFNSAVDDHVMRAQDAIWGDGTLNWLVLHACQTMRANFEWDVWCDAFNGLHMMFGFHTNTEGSTPPLGSRFALWMKFEFPPWWYARDMRTAWGMACAECFDSSREYAVIYTGQAGTDTHNDHLPGFGHVSSDPTSPTYWVYYKASC